MRGEDLIFGGFSGILGTCVTGTSLGYLDFWTMQIKNQTFSDFVERTDSLADVLKCDVQDLTEILGFSRASLFAYRAGKVRITEKAWKKLEAAESKAGAGRGLYQTREGIAAPSSPNIVRESGDEGVIGRLERLELEVAELKALVLKIRNTVNLPGR